MESKRVFFVVQMDLEVRRVILAKAKELNIIDIDISLEMILIIYI